VEAQWATHPQTQGHSAGAGQRLGDVELRELHRPLLVTRHDVPDPEPLCLLEVAVRGTVDQPRGDIGEHAADVALGGQEIVEP
jgi:hypothetical protein